MVCLCCRADKCEAAAPVAGRRQGNGHPRLAGKGTELEVKSHFACTAMLNAVQLLTYLALFSCLAFRHIRCKRTLNTSRKLLFPGGVRPPPPPTPSSLPPSRTNTHCSLTRLFLYTFFLYKKSFLTRHLCPGPKALLTISYINIYTNQSQQAFSSSAKEGRLAREHSQLHTELRSRIARKSPRSRADAEQEQLLLDKMLCIVTEKDLVTSHWSFFLRVFFFGF